MLLNGTLHAKMTLWDRIHLGQHPRHRKRHRHVDHHTYPKRNDDRPTYILGGIFDFAAAFRDRCEALWGRIANAMAARKPAAP